MFVYINYKQNNNKKSKFGYAGETRDGKLLLNKQKVSTKRNNHKNQ